MRRAKATGLRSRLLSLRATGLYGALVVRASKSRYTSEERTINVSDPVSFWNFGLRRP